MVEWVRLAVPAAIVASMGSPSHAIQYLTVEQSRTLSFPSATDFVAIDAQAWKVASDGKTVGRYIVDHVIGKHLYIRRDAGRGWPYPEGRYPAIS
jgi:hypothetical protein